MDCDKIKVPESANFLKLVFEINTDFVLPADGEIAGRHQLGDNCWLEPAKLQSRRLIYSATYDRMEEGPEETTIITQTIERSGGKVFYTKKIPVSYLSGHVTTDITFGTEDVFTSTNVDELCFDALTSTTFVVYYADANDGSKEKSVVGTVSGNEITYGSVYEFNDTATDYTRVVAISDTQFAVFFKDLESAKFSMHIDVS